MKERGWNGNGPPGARPSNATRERRRLGAALACTAVAAIVSASPVAAESTGVQMRRARFALARGAASEAAADLDRVRQREPGSARGLEAAMLLADLEVTAGRAERADSVLADAERAAPPSIDAPIRLARAWLALGRGVPGEARDRFDAIRGSEIELARDVAEIGLAWSALASGHSYDRVSELQAIADRDGPPTLRLGASWTLSRVHAADGEHRRALREVRRLRRDFRGSTLEDDLELLLGLAQLEAGRSRDALRTFRRLERRHGSRAKAPAAQRVPVDAGLRLEDLRAGNADFVGRVAELYAGRATRTVGLLSFLGALFDREAALDAPAAIALAERSLAASKGGVR